MDHAAFAELKDICSLLLQALPRQAPWGHGDSGHKPCPQVAPDPAGDNHEGPHSWFTVELPFPLPFKADMACDLL